MFMNGLKYHKDFDLWTVGNGLSSLIYTNTAWSGIICCTRANQITEHDLASNDQQIGGGGMYEHCPRHFPVRRVGDR
ncbi:hypothetical protein SADUNF_Sadunf16G0173700 [Salix dunnii]|uniref:Uncharacterized protein n=1 Tax=Salix dunnii TaxID=1413687 RepID=A0A835J9B4_9ROSI|nr:hypothetical protein SADUNF_Sadunf16G0173700 [Salix dunnii]